MPWLHLIGLSSNLWVQGWCVLRLEFILIDLYMCIVLFFTPSAAPVWFAVPFLILTSTYYLFSLKMR